MFKRVLIPTDGSAVAAKAIRHGIDLAKQLGVTIVAYHAVEPIERLYYEGGRSARPSSVKPLQAKLTQQGQHHLDAIVKAAQAAGVPCETVLTSPATPHQGIIEAARAKKCDAIFMASHGRDRIASLVLGSVTQRVLAHSKLPVLVFR